MTTPQGMPPRPRAARASAGHHPAVASVGDPIEARSAERLRTIGPLTRALTALALAATTAAAPSPPAQALTWRDCGDGMECAKLDVPVDWNRPDGPRTEVDLARMAARDPARRLGSLVVNEPRGLGDKETWWIKALWVPHVDSRVRTSEGRLRGMGLSDQRHEPMITRREVNLQPIGLPPGSPSTWLGHS